MNRIPFDISLRPQIEAGEYKVVDKDNNPVTILDWDAKCYKGKLIYKYEALGVEFSNQDNGDNLFLVLKEQTLTEFEKELKAMIQDIENGDFTDESFNFWRNRLLDIARKELRPEFDKEMDKMLAETDKVVYQKGKQDALKDLPKLEKTKDCIDPTIPIMYTNTPSMKSFVEYHGYKLCINDVFEKLPKEE